MNNQELFIKYLDEQLPKSELENFDSKLEIDSEFKNEFLSFKNNYESSKIKYPVDERYFDNLIPNAKGKLKKTKKNTVIKIAYAVPVIIAILFYANSKFINVSQDFDTQEIFEEFTADEELTKELLNNALSLESYYNLDDELVSEIYNDEINIDESLFEYLEDNIYADDFSDSFIEELSDEEFSNVFKELTDKNIL